MRPFLGLAPSKLKIFSKKFNGSICAYRVLYLPIFRRIEGGVESSPPPRSLRYRKKRGPEREKGFKSNTEKYEHALFRLIAASLWLDKMYYYPRYFFNNNFFLYVSFTLSLFWSFGHKEGRRLSFLLYLV